MTIVELINLGEAFEWNYPQLQYDDGTVSDIISENKIVSNQDDYTLWLYKVKRMFQKEYSNDVMFGEVINLTSTPKPNTRTAHIQVMGILHAIFDEPQLCNSTKPETSPSTIIENNNYINIGITLYSITDGLSQDQIAELKKHFASNPKDKEGFFQKLLSFGVDATTILCNILGTEPIWNAITNLFSK